MHSGGLLVAVVGGAVAIYFLYQRTRYVRGFFQRRRATAKWVDHVTAARSVFANPCPYRPLDPARADEIAALAKVDARHGAERTALETVGFVAIAASPADATAVRAPDGKLLSVARLMVDAARTTTVLLTTVGVFFESFTDEALEITSRGDSSHVAEGPIVRRRGVAAGTTTADLVAAHRTFAGQHETPPRTLAPIADRAAFIVRTAERWDAMRAWRQTQAPAALLDEDLRGLLGAARYAKFGKLLAANMGDALPTATALR